VKKKVTDEQLITAVYESKNIRQALLRLGIAARGNNYYRAKKLMESGFKPPVAKRRKILRKATLKDWVQSLNSYFEH
jgi:hypothetical protein